MSSFRVVLWALLCCRFTLYSASSGDFLPVSWRGIVLSPLKQRALQVLLDQGWRLELITALQREQGSDNQGGMPIQAGLQGPQSFLGQVSASAAATRARVEQLQSTQGVQKEASEGGSAEEPAVHRDQRGYCCSTCNRTFTKKRNLRRHMNEVHGEGSRVTCRVCEKQFARKGALEKHNKAVHQGLKPYACSVCGKLFGDPSNRRKHVVNVHRD